MLKKDEVNEIVKDIVTKIIEKEASNVEVMSLLGAIVTSVMVVGGADLETVKTLCEAIVIKYPNALEAAEDFNKESCDDK